MYSSVGIVFDEFRVATRHPCPEETCLVISPLIFAHGVLLQMATNYWQDLFYIVSSFRNGPETQTS